jgi:hypothetical protein
MSKIKTEIRKLIHFEIVHNVFRGHEFVSSKNWILDNPYFQLILLPINRSTFFQIFKQVNTVISSPDILNAVA